MGLKSSTSNFAFPVTALGLLVMICFSGCGSGENRQVMTGEVTWLGKPLEKGVITFYPKGQGDTVGTEILSGKFTIKQENGAMPGKYRVEIIAFRPTGKSEFDVDQKKQVSIEEQYLPKQYNSASTLEADVADGKDNKFQFDLQAGK